MALNMIAEPSGTVQLHISEPSTETQHTFGKSPSGR